MPCTSLCSIAGTLMRRTSPCTRIIGGNPEDRCRSDALFLTTKASSSVRSITILPGVPCEVFFFAGSTHYGNNCRQPASREGTHRARCAGCRARSCVGDFVGSVQDACGRAHRRGKSCRPERIRGELCAGSAGKNGSDRREARVASDRTAPKQQDQERRGALRLGADCRPGKDCKPPVAAE